MNHPGAIVYGWRATLPPESAEWTLTEELAMEDLELYETALQGLSQMHYEEES